MTIKNYPATDLQKRLIKVTLVNEGLGMTKKDRQATEKMLTQQNATAKAGSVIKSKYNPNNALLRKYKTQRGLVGNLHRSMTAPWDDSKGRVIKATHYDVYLERVREEISTAMTIADEIAGNWNAIVADSHGFDFNLGDMFDAGDYPTAEEVRDSFRMEIVTELLPDMGHPQIDLDADRIEKIQEEAAIRERNKLEAASVHTAKMVSEEIKDLYEALDRFGQVRAADPNDPEDKPRPQTFRDTLVPRMQKLAETLPGLNLTDDPKLDKLAQDIATLVAGTDSKELREDAKKRDTVKDGAKEILDNVDHYFAAPAA